MNEKIKELMLEATKDMPETYYWPGQYVEKFSELIAKECAELCDRFQERDVGMQPAECAGAIRAMFGIR